MTLQTQRWWLAGAVLLGFGLAIAPLGIEWSDANDALGASDMSVLGRAGMPALNFMQNSNDYFHYHHTPNDTFDKIIPDDIRYLTAAYATIFFLAAELDVDFSR